MCSLMRAKGFALITPSEPTPAHVLSLSALDSQLFLRFSIDYLLVYKPPPHQLDQTTISARIKAALAEALVPYYPLAGQVRSKPDGSSLEVVCRAQGAFFMETFSDLTLGDFEKAPAYVTKWRELLSLHAPDVLKGDPPLIVQLTWLKDGAAALAFGFNHCIIDGLGSAEFLNSFADLATGKQYLAELKVQPVWDRHLLNLNPKKSKSTIDLPVFNQVPDLCGFESRFLTNTLNPTSIIFETRHLRELKKLASNNQPSSVVSASFTSFEVLSAHVWRSWSRALSLPSSQIIKMLFSLNVRDRVQPNLPGGYYGNAFVLGCAQTTVKDLTEKGLDYAAGLVKRAKERVDDGYVREVIESVSESRASPDLVGVLIVSQWSRLGLEKVDFGLGRPVHVGSVCVDKYCLLLPVHDQTDAVKVMVAVPTCAVDQYEYFLKNPYS